MNLDFSQLDARRPLRFNNCTLFDGERHFPKARMSATVQDGRITAVDEAHPAEEGEQSIDLDGLTLMPGLIDAHFHANSPSLDIARADELHASHLAQYARSYLEAQLERGFTTVRDAGGADPGLARSVEDGLIKGPRLLVSGRAISQTGGHGDFRRSGELCGCSGYSGAIGCVVDGPDDMRRHVREQFRQGVNQIKLFMSGGVLSPTDPIWMDQFTDQEVRTAVEEAERRRSYVMAHAHNCASIRRAAALGVRSIEHGSLMDGPTADFVAEKGTYVVPTLTVISCLTNGTLDLPAAVVEKAKEISGYAREAVRHADRAGVKVGLGTDLVGELHGLEMNELLLRGDVSGNLNALRSATSINAEILQMKGMIGTIEAGAYADFIIVDGDPIADLKVIASEENRIRMIFKGGQVTRGRPLHDCL